MPQTLRLFSGIRKGHLMDIHTDRNNSVLAHCLRRVNFLSLPGIVKPFFYVPETLGPYHSKRFRVIELYEAVIHLCQQPLISFFFSFIDRRPLFHTPDGKRIYQNGDRFLDHKIFRDTAAVLS